MITWVETACLPQQEAHAPAEQVACPSAPVELSKVLTLILVWGLVQGDYSEFRLYGCVL